MEHISSGRLEGFPQHWDLVLVERSDEIDEPLRDIADGALRNRTLEHALDLGLNFLALPAVEESQHADLGQDVESVGVSWSHKRGERLAAVKFPPSLSVLPDTLRGSDG
jgi:hypothetical protein